MSCALQLPSLISSCACEEPWTFLWRDLLDSRKFPWGFGADLTAEEAEHGAIAGMEPISMSGGRNKEAQAVVMEGEARDVFFLHPSRTRHE